MCTRERTYGLSPDENIGFFNSLNPSSRTMALGSTQPLKEISTRNLPGGKGRPAHNADNLTADCLENMGASTSHSLFFMVIASSLCSSRNKEMQKSRTQRNDYECPR
jgi:hypothetical protein